MRSRWDWVSPVMMDGGGHLIATGLMVGGIAYMLASMHHASDKEKPETAEVEVVRMSGLVYRRGISRALSSDCYDFVVENDQKQETTYHLLASNRIEQQFLGEAMIDPHLLDKPNDRLKRRYIALKGIVALRGGDEYFNIIEILSPTKEEVDKDMRWLREERAKAQEPK